MHIETLFCNTSMYHSTCIVLSLCATLILHGHTLFSIFICNGKKGPEQFTGATSLNAP